MIQAGLLRQISYNDTICLLLQDTAMYMRRDGGNPHFLGGQSPQHIFILKSTISFNPAAGSPEPQIYECEWAFHGNRAK
jgi:hypothetical protein